MHFADLDDTLYPLSCGIAKGCLKNIQGKLAMSCLNSRLLYLNCTWVLTAEEEINLLAQFLMWVLSFFSFFFL